MHHFEPLARLAADAVAAVGKTWHVESSVAASPSDLDRCESIIGTQLPASYRTFLERSNGVTLGIQRRALVRYEIELFSTDQIAARTLQHRSYAQESFPEESFEGLVVFADTMDGDICLFDQTQSSEGRVPVLGGWHEVDPDEWRDTVIATDFDQWLRNILMYVAEFGNHDDFRYWWERGWSLKS